MTRGSPSSGNRLTAASSLPTVGVVSREFVNTASGARVGGEPYPMRRVRHTLVMHGTELLGAGSGDVTIVLEPATSFRLSVDHVGHLAIEVEQHYRHFSGFYADDPSGWSELPPSKYTMRFGCNWDSITLRPEPE
jgi:hypothetical protein